MSTPEPVTPESLAAQVYDRGEPITVEQLHALHTPAEPTAGARVDEGALDEAVKTLPEWMRGEVEYALHGTACVPLDETDDPCRCGQSIIRHLVRALADARADRERVNWMERHPSGCAVRHVHTGDWRVTDVDSYARNHVAPTLRDAIDFARTAERGRDDA